MPKGQAGQPDFPRDASGPSGEKGPSSGLLNVLGFPLWAIFVAWTRNNLKETGMTIGLRAVKRPPATPRRCTAGERRLFLASVKVGRRAVFEGFENQIIS